jgi:hypothetical protein
MLCLTRLLDSTSLQHLVAEADLHLQVSFPNPANADALGG